MYKYLYMYIYLVYSICIKLIEIKRVKLNKVNKTEGISWCWL